MKKILVCALLLGLMAGFSACGGKPENPTEPVDTTTIETTAVTETATEGTPKEEVTETTTQPEETEETTDEAPAALTPDKMDKAQLLKYYNDAVNYVREKKPAIVFVETQRIDKIDTTVLGGALDGLINSTKARFMPGDPVTKNIKKGQENYKWFSDADQAGLTYEQKKADKFNYFLSPMKVSGVQPGDVASAKAVKSGDNYVITLTVANETNPKNNSSSRHAKLMSVATGQEVLDELAGIVTADVNKVKMNYHSAKAEITVNPQGQIVKAYTEFRVDVSAKDAKALIFTGNIDGKQFTSYAYNKFDY